MLESKARNNQLQTELGDNIRINVQRAIIGNTPEQKLHDYVSIVKISPEARMEYMMWEEKIFYEKLEAKEAGRVQGHAEGCSALRDTLKAILCEKGSVTECLEKRIISENDFEVLSRWIRIAAKVESVELFMSDME